MILDSSRLADDSQAQELAQGVYGNRSWLSVAAEDKTFRPIEGDTGDKATDAFVRPSVHGVYVALFNYDEKRPQTITIPLERIDKTIAGGPSVTVIDVASGAKLQSSPTDLNVKLSPSESTLLELRWK
jgi:alpha-galactosidase